MTALTGMTRLGPSFVAAVNVGIAKGEVGPNTPQGFAFIRTTPGTLMKNQNETYVIAPALADQRVSA